MGKRSVKAIYVSASTVAGCVTVSFFYDNETMHQINRAKYSSVSRLGAFLDRNKRFWRVSAYPFGMGYRAHRERQVRAIVIREHFGRWLRPQVTIVEGYHTREYEHVSEASLARIRRLNDVSIKWVIVDV